MICNQNGRWVIVWDDGNVDVPANAPRSLLPVATAVYASYIGVANEVVA
jgi:hypothetical protein